MGYTQQTPRVAWGFSKGGFTGTVGSNRGILKPIIDSVDG